MKDELGSRALELRARFDEAFTRPAQVAQDGALADLLMIRIGDTRYALRLDEVSGVAADRKLVPVPSEVAGFLGVVALRGEVTPVYSLAALLGHGSRAGARWLALCTAGALHLALSFDALEGHLRIPRQRLREAGAAETHHHVRAVIQVDDAACPVISLPSVMESIRTLCGLDRSPLGASS